MACTCYVCLISLGAIFAQADGESRAENSYRHLRSSIVEDLSDAREQVAAATDIQDEVYKTAIAGTCHSNGLQPIYDAESCSQAASALGYMITSGPHTGNIDVVDGCSVRYGEALFLEKRLTNCTELALPGSCTCRPFPHTCLCKGKRSQNAEMDINRSQIAKSQEAAVAHSLDIPTETSQEAPSVLALDIPTETSQEAPSVLAFDIPTETSQEAPSVRSPDIPMESYAVDMPQTWEEVDALLQRLQSKGELAYVASDEEVSIGNDANSEHVELVVDSQFPEPALRETNIEKDSRYMTDGNKVGLSPTMHNHSHIHPNHSHIHPAVRRLDDPVTAEVHTLIMRPTSSAVEILLKLRDVPVWSGVQPFFLVPCEAPDFSVVMPPLEFDSQALRSGQATWVRFKNLEPSTEYCIKLTDNLKGTDFPSGWSFVTPPRQEL